MKNWSARPFLFNLVAVDNKLFADLSTGLLQPSSRHKSKSEVIQVNTRAKEYILAKKNNKLSS